jgi:hypothetical protein
MRCNYEQHVSSATSKRHCRPPQVREISLAQTKAKLQSSALPEDCGTREMLRCIEELTEKEKSGANPRDRQARVARVIVGLLVLALGVVPCLVLYVLAGGGNSALGLELRRLPVFFWAAWAVLCSWVALSVAELTAVLGNNTDPLAPGAVYLVVLAVANCLSVFAFLIRQ